MTSALAAPVRRSLATALICDDRPAARRLMTHALTAGMAIDVVTAVSNALEASVAYTERPADVVLISLRRGGTVELDRFTELLRLHPGAAVIVFGDTRDIGLLTTAVTRGALGLMLWDPVRPGPTSPPGPSQSVRIRPGYPKHSPVNDRDLQVLRGISDGKSNGCIGREMFLSENTIKSHAHHLFEKLGARDRAHAVMIALRLELIS